MRLTFRLPVMLPLITALMFVLASHSMAKETDTESPIGGVGGAVHADPFTGTVSSPVKATLPMENFWLPVGPDTASAEAPPARHGAAPRCNSATIPR